MKYLTFNLQKVFSYWYVAAWAKTVATDVVSSRPASVANFILPVSSELGELLASFVYRFHSLLSVAYIMIYVGVSIPPLTMWFLRTFYYNLGGNQWI